METANRFGRIMGRDIWCVPAALAALTGWSTDLLRCLIVGLSWRTSCWAGVTTNDTTLALRELGIDGRPHTYHDSAYGKRPTLNQWAAAHQNGYFMVAAGCHMILIRDGVVVDNGTYASKEGVHYTELHHGKRARMDWSMEFDNVDWHERQDDHQPPSWAVCASKELQDARIANGNEARIPVARIKDMKDRHETLARIQAAERQREHEAKLEAERQAKLEADRKAAEERKPRKSSAASKRRRSGTARSGTRRPAAVARRRRRGKACARAAGGRLFGTGNSAEPSARLKAATGSPRRRAAAGTTGASMPTTS